MEPRPLKEREAERAYVLAEKKRLIAQQDTMEPVLLARAMWVLAKKMDALVEEYTAAKAAQDAAREAARAESPPPRRRRKKT